MCFHRCFENMTLKARYPWYNSPPTRDYETYCTGSRNHGCHGCFCRRPDINPHSLDRCYKCGKCFYELLDALWEVRREVYRQYAFKEHSWEELFSMEYTIEQRLLEDDAVAEVKSPNIGRFKIIQVYTTAAKRITDAVIEEEMSKMVSH
jgi:hypothetical protein